MVVVTRVVKVLFREINISNLSLKLSNIKIKQKAPCVESNPCEANGNCINTYVSSDSDYKRCTCVNGYTGDNCETGNLRCYCDIVKGRKRDNNLFYLVKLKIHVTLNHANMMVHAQITQMRQVHIIAALAQMDIRDPIVKYVKKIEFRILPFNKNQIKLNFSK